MDPQQRQLLERGYAALHSAGSSKATLLSGVVAVNVGQWASEFGSVLMHTPAGRSVYASTGFSCSATCGRVSFALGLQGPCASYDTACSSSLVANHGSVHALRWSECDAALSAGINMILDPSAMSANAVAGFTSVRGRSHTFDARADGYARGEAIDVMACRLGERTIVRVLGSVVRQDGRSASLTAPNGRAQQNLLSASLGDTRLATDEVASLQAHGTGTALGDPIEAGALAGALLAHRLHDPLVVGSLKANAGHTEPGAGVAGALGLLAQLKDKSASPNAQLRELNSHVCSALRDMRCALAMQLSVLRGVPSVGGVSSFGYAGTIAHLLLAFADDGGGEALALGSAQRPLEALAFGTRGGETASELLGDEVLAKVALFANSSERHSRLPLRLLRRSFPWAKSHRCDMRVAASHVDDALVRDIPVGLVASEAALDVDIPLMSTGVNSIAAVRLASRLRSQTGLDLPSTLIFEHPTVRAISLYLNGRSVAGSLTTPNAITMALEDVLTSMASPAQAIAIRNSLTSGTGFEDNWRSTRKEIMSTAEEAFPMSASMLRDSQVKAFHMQQLYQLNPDDNVQLVLSSLMTLIAVHPMLRARHTPPLFFTPVHASTEFDVVDPLTGPHAFTRAATTLYASFSRLAKYASGAADADKVLLRKVVLPFIALPIEPSVAALRARMLCVRQQAACLVLSIHHMVLDGPSQQIVHTHLTSVLEAQRRAQPADLPPHDASAIARHAIVHHMHMLSAPLEPALALDACQLRLPFAELDGRRSDTAACHVLNIHVAQQTIATAQASARRMGVTLNSFLLGTLAWLLHELSEQQCLAISQTYLGREMEQLQAVGSYSASVPMVFNFSDSPTLSMVCRHVQKETQRILAFDAIMQSVQSVAVAYELNDVRPMERPTEYKQLPYPFLLLDLFFTVNQFSDGFSVMALYDNGKCDAASVDDCAQRWINIWEQQIVDYVLTEHLAPTAVETN